MLQVKNHMAGLTLGKRVPMHRSPQRCRQFRANVVVLQGDSVVARPRDLLGVS